MGPAADNESFNDILHRHMILSRDLLGGILRHCLPETDVDARHMAVLIDTHGKAVELFERCPFPENLSQSLALVHKILPVRSMVKEHFILIGQQPNFPESGTGRDFFFPVLGKHGDKRIEDVFSIIDRYLNLAFFRPIDVGYAELHGAVRCNFEKFIFIF